MDNFQNTVKQARYEAWAILEHCYKQIQIKDDKLIEYILLHLIKTIPHSKIRLGPRWQNGIVEDSKRYLEVEKDYTVFLSIEDDMCKYKRKEDDIAVLKAEDKLYISAHISDAQSLCCDAIKVSELTLDALTNKINEMIGHLKEKKNNIIKRNKK